MEDVLDIYERPHNPALPVVCFDETSKQLVEHTRTPLPVAKGTARRIDDEYRRCGTANIFVAVEPLTGKVVTKVTERRTAVDCAQFLQHLADEVYPDVEQIVLIMDNLNTHKPASLYEAFEPAEARRLAKRFEWHYTPKHGSWLDVAEMQISVIARQCLDQRIGTLKQLRRILNAWHETRKTVPVCWQFTNDKARIKLRRLYPATQ